MIGWLQGQRLDNWSQALRKGIVLACSGIGYEVQLLPRYLAEIGSNEKLTLWIHQVKRDDSESLYGFQLKSERDLFRLLIGVNGIGPQIAIALLEELKVDNLISAIIFEDIRILSKAQGIGKRTAERLTIELRHKLAELTDTSIEIPTQGSEVLKEGPPYLSSSYINELKGTLQSLGYEDFEINRAIDAVAKESQSGSNLENKNSQKSVDDFGALLKASLLLLSNESK